MQNLAYVDHSLLQANWPVAGASLEDRNLNEFQIILLLMKNREKREILQYPLHFPLISL